MKNIYLIIITLLLFTSCAQFPKKNIQHWVTLPPTQVIIPQSTLHHREVIATAYTSRECETDDTPCIAAWNNRLYPDTQSIAVSRDLLKIGLTSGAKVRISGFEGEFKVLDKMNKRWKNRIDIYMGDDLQRALNWGKRDVTITWKHKITIAKNPLNAFNTTPKNNYLHTKFNPSYVLLPHIP